MSELDKFPDSLSGPGADLDKELRAAVGRQVTHPVGHPPSCKYTTFDDSPGSTHVRVVSFVPPGSRVLEFGCATGYMSQVLATRLGCAVTAIEISPEAAELAAEHCERVVIGDADELDFVAIFDSDRFDRIIFADVLEHLRKPAEVLRRIAPFVADDGAIVASIPNIAHGSVRLALLAGEFRYRDLGLLDDTHLRFFTREGIQDLFEESGYVITNWGRRRIDIDESEIRAPVPVPDAIRDWLADDGEVTTYQYIVRAVPARASSQLGMLRGLLASRNGEVDALRPLEDTVERQRAELEQLGAEAEQLRHELEQERARVAAADTELERLRDLDAEEQARLLAANADADQHWQAQLQDVEELRQAAELEAVRLRDVVKHERVRLETELERVRTSVEEEQVRLLAANADADQRWQAQLHHVEELRQAAELEAARLREAAETSNERLRQAEAELALLRQAAEHAGSLRAAAEAEAEGVRRVAEVEREQRAALEARLEWVSARETDLREMLLDANEQLLRHEVEDGLQPESREEEFRALSEDLERERAWLHEVLGERERELAWRRESVVELQATLARIFSTRLWRVGRRYWKFKRFLGG
jgi:2-polyprenyl-3-methyl-5-hydroxy-6-metoxy-1,4-benzoquinol methylase